MPRPAAPPATPAVVWLSLGPASRLIGVDPDTLRRWADTGRVRAFATPGGHRRFSRADLDRLAAERRARPQPLAALGATSERLSKVYARAYRGVPIPPDQVAPDDREAFRAEGRRLVAVILAYLDATRIADRARWEAEAMALTGAAATRLAEAGAKVPEVIAIYLRARRPLLGELAAIGRRRALDPTRLADLHERAIDLLDRLLLHLVVSHAAASPDGRSSSWA